MQTRLLACLFLGLILPAARAAEPATGPAETRPATQPAALDPAVERILDSLEQKGRAIHDIQASILYVKRDVVLDDKQQYEGTLYFKEEQPNPRFLIRFDKNVHDGVLSTKREWHAFDGGWYIEARESTTTVSKHQVVCPGEKINVFRLGEGPFPLPFGQKKSDIMQNFSCKLVPPGSKDPANTDHLECTPLPGSRLAKQYDTVHFFIDRDLDLPVKLTTVKKDEDQEISVTFTNVRLNKGIPGSELNMPAATETYGTTENRRDDCGKTPERS